MVDIKELFENWDPQMKLKQIELQKCVGLANLFQANRIAVIYHG